MNLTENVSPVFIQKTHLYFSIDKAPAYISVFTMADARKSIIMLLHCKRCRRCHEGPSPLQVKITVSAPRKS